MDRTILITGATDGLGKALAFKFASTSTRLLLHGRNKHKGEKLLHDLYLETKNSNISFYTADFSSLNEVNEMSREILDQHDHIDLLINNAAVGGGPRGTAERELSKDGYELRFAVNYLSHFLLTNKLIPLLENSNSPRIVLVSSIGQAKIDFTDLMMEKMYDSFTAYCRSKLAQIIYGFSLAEKLKPLGITVNSVHPATQMPTNMVFEFFGKSTSTVEDGMDSVLYVCCSEETSAVTGNYFNQRNIAKAHTQAYDVSARQRLWNISETLIQMKINYG